MNNPVIEAIDAFFSDMSRTPEQTRAGLQDALSHIEIIIESLPESEEDFQG